MFRNYSECYSYRRYSGGTNPGFRTYVQKSPFTVQVLQGRLGARYGSRWSCRRGTAAWRGRGRPAPRQGGRGERPGELAVGHCNERARPVCLFISWWISGPTYSFPHTEYLLGVGSTYGTYSVGTNKLFATWYTTWYLHGVYKCRMHYW